MNNIVDYDEVLRLFEKDELTDTWGDWKYVNSLHEILNDEKYSQKLFDILKSTNNSNYWLKSLSVPQIKLMIVNHPIFDSLS